jgi:ornithine carbamoyltransferase
MRSYLKFNDFNRTEVESVLQMAAEFKAQRGKKTWNFLKGQTWALMFSKSSTRTRVSFEVGLRELGAETLFLSAQDIQLGRGEPIIDTARVLGKMVHGAVIRTYAQKDVEDFASYSGMPTINALTDDEHPCQILTDILTFEERRGSIRGKKVVFVGDADCNMGRSWVHAAEVMDFQLVCAAPDTYQTKVTNANVTLTSDPKEAAEGADLLYTDVWVSMGKEDEAALRKKEFQGYQINADLIRRAKPDALVLHCLPAYRGMEITEEVLEQNASVIFEQAGNRLPTQQAIVAFLVGQKP